MTKKKRGRPRSKNPSSSALYHRKWREKQGILFGDELWDKIINGFKKFLEPPFNERNIKIIKEISNYINLEKRDKNWFGVCIFHDEETPSFAVFPEKNTFHCFGCGANGNVSDFIKLITEKKKGDKK